VSSKAFKILVEKSQGARGLLRHWRAWNDNIKKYLNTLRAGDADLLF